MRIRLALLLAAGALLAVPVAASGHPMQINSLGAFGTGAAATFMTPPPTFPGPQFTTSRNMQLLGYSPRLETTFPQFGSDLAFWGDRAYQGSFSGFRIIDIKDPKRPKQLIDYRDCAHPSGQGDVVVWGSILVRTWDANNRTAGLTCDGEPVPAGAPVPPGQPAPPPDFGDGFEGVHVFDVSDPGNPDLVASVETRCGSHTATGVPDLKNRRLLVYSTPSQNDTQPLCHGIDIIEVPLSRPEESELLRSEFAGRNQADAFQFRCHDTAVILGRANKAACAGGIGFAVWSLGGKDGGSRDNPRFLYNRVVPEIAAGPPNADPPTGHSASFSWDGETLIFGHEPSGGVGPRCQATGAPIPNTSQTQTDDMKSFFFYDTDSGAATGKWTLTRAQSVVENCTLHNYNVVPTKKDDILVQGSYQSGIGVLDFSNTAKVREIAFADPAPLNPNAFTIGGDWSSYFYNGIIYQADITRGLFTWRLKGERDVDRAMKLRHLNPQTQEFTIGAKKDRDRWNDDDKWHDDSWDDREDDDDEDDDD